MADVKPIPEGYHSITPYLIIDGAADALEYYKKAFGATELFRMEHGGKIGHAEMKIGDSPFMLADEHPEEGHRGPKALGGSPVGIMIYVEDVDTIFKQAIDAGGSQVKPLQDQFYGDRSGSLTDPFGHVWTVATHKEDVSSEEIDRRLKAMAAGGQGG
jgi:PhnB protein